MIFSYDKVSANTASSVHNVTKNRRDHRVHIEGIQVCQINSWHNSLQNMYCMVFAAKIDRLARKIDFVQKKHLKNGYFCVHELELPDFGRT